MVAKIDDVRRTITSNFKAKGDLIYLVGETYDELGGSEFYKLFDELGANVPKIRRENAKRIYHKMMKANDAEIIESSHDISDGGLAVTVAEKAFSCQFGVEIILDNCKDISLNAILFAESHSRFVVSIQSINKYIFEDYFGNDARFIGKVTNDAKLQISKGKLPIIDIEVAELINAWDKGLDKK